jgi:hypothetical protein
VTGLLCTRGQQFQDWSAEYRLYGEPRFDLTRIWGVLRRQLFAAYERDPRHKNAPFLVALDDTLVRKTGTHIHGAAWRRDPLSPPFQTNLVRGQRILQLSAAYPAEKPDALPRMIPIDLAHVPTPPKPRKTDPPPVWQAYRLRKRQANITRHGALHISTLRQNLDAEYPTSTRPLWILVDGRFTNRTLLKVPPPRTTIIGRLRADAKLFFLPPPDLPPRRGRKRSYGPPASTPRKLQQDETIPWQTVKVFAVGKFHDFRIKNLGPVLWPSAGPHCPLRLIVIAPLAYRLRKGSRLLYRQPAYLLCTDPNADLTAIVQAYVARWDIEVNFRDEKQLLGLGQAQVRTPTAVQYHLARVAIAYAFLLLAAARAFGPNGHPDALPPALWRKRLPGPRASTAELIRLLRHELWADALNRPNFSHFTSMEDSTMKPEKFQPHLASAVLYASP